jgi:branched-chain amino acid transport system permease protein
MAAAGAIVLLGAPHLMPNSYWLRIYSMAGLWVMLALGLNVVAGFAGLLDLAYIAFFGIGGYTFALLSSEQLGIHLPFWLVWPLAASFAAAVGFGLGATSLRLKGDYLAIVTLAFAQIFRLLLVNLDSPVNITGGVNGIFNFDPIRLFGFVLRSPEAYAYLIWGAAVATAVGVSRIRRSRIGRGWESIREDELAAEAMGVDTTRMKLLAFAGGAFVAGAAGAVFASFQDSVFPNSFDFPQLIIVYCMVILGGLGNIAGVIAGAILLAILPEFLREYGAYRMMAYGLILVVLMALRPQGLMGDVDRLLKKKRRPDKDETGRLRASTELYYAAAPTGSTAKPPAAPATRPTGTVMLALEEVTKEFGGLKAVDGLSLTLRAGEILSVIGPNGAGKTTVFNMLSGIYPPTRGAIRFEGRDIAGLRPHEITAAGIARTFQNLRLFGALSVLDNAKVARFCRTRSGPLAILLKLPASQREEAETDRRAREILALFGARLTGYRLGQPAGTLSYANRRRLEIARAMATGARLLLLDEPSAGMNPQETQEITEFIQSLRNDHGYTILVIEHKLNVVRTVSDRVIALDHGVKIAEGSFEAVAADPQVIEAYLGRRQRRTAA